MALQLPSLRHLLFSADRVLGVRQLKICSAQLSYLLFIPLSETNKKPPVPSQSIATHEITSFEATTGLALREGYEKLLPCRVVMLPQD